MELSYTQNKLQFNRPSFKDELKDKLGTVCCNCGSNLDVEYHHVVNKQYREHCTSLPCLPSNCTWIIKHKGHKKSGENRKT